jgi:acetyl-CoA C-acetyltransferase
MTKATQQAAAAVNCPALLEQCQRIYVPEGMWAYKDPARIIADNIQAAAATTVFAKIGITQQTLMGEACQRIQEGKESIILVSGGEAKFRQLQSNIQGIEITDTVQADDVEADVVMQPGAELWLIEETTAGLGMPVSYYSLMESAYRHAKGQSIDENRDKLAEIYSHFSHAGAANPNAWKREAISADYIRNPSAKNPMLAFPYTKLHNTSWNVNQACAMFFTSVEKATELGIDESHWIYPQVSTENNAMLAVAQRPDIHRSVGAELAAKAALSYTELSAKDIAVVDLYSCFPVAVEM